MTRAASGSGDGEHDDASHVPAERDALEDPAAAQQPGRMSRGIDALFANHHHTLCSTALPIVHTVRLSAWLLE